MKQRRDDMSCIYYLMFVCCQAAPEGEPRHYRHSPGLRVAGGEGGWRPHSGGQLRAGHHLQGELRNIESADRVLICTEEELQEQYHKKCTLNNFLAIWAIW